MFNKPRNVVEIFSGAGYAARVITIFNCRNGNDFAKHACACGSSSSWEGSELNVRIRKTRPLAF